LKAASATATALSSGYPVWALSQSMERNGALHDPAREHWLVR
jgi:hypothetical protein